MVPFNSVKGWVAYLNETTCHLPCEHNLAYFTENFNAVFLDAEGVDATSVRSAQLLLLQDFLAWTTTKEVRLGFSMHLGPVPTNCAGSLA